MNLKETLPELAADVMGALIREGRGRVADQLAEASLQSWKFDDFAQATYLQLTATFDPDAIGETISFYDDIGVNVHLDNAGQVVGLEVIGYEQVLARLGPDTNA